MIKQVPENPEKNRKSTETLTAIAFGGVSPAGEIISMIAVQYVVKLLVESIAGTPMVYGLVAWIQRRK